MKQRGLGNPNTRGGGARQDAQDAITKKFQHMQTAFQREAKIEALKNTDSATRNNVLKLIERKIKELTDQVTETSNKGAEANLRAQLAAWNHWKTTFEAKGLEKGGAIDITKNFYAWLLGKGVEEDHRRTPWYRDQALLELPDVQEWIDGFNDVLSESQNELLKLVWKTPQNLEEAWLYYKYVVHMDWMQKEDRFFWVDMINLMEEKAKLGGGYLQSQLDDPNVNTPSQLVTKDGVTYRVPLNQNDAFNPANFPAYQPVTDKQTTPHVSLRDQLRELADVHKLSSLDPVVPKIRAEIRDAATRDILEANDTRPVEQVAVEVVEAVEKIEDVGTELIDALTNETERIPELNPLREQTEKLTNAIQRNTPSGWFGWGVNLLASAVEGVGGAMMGEVTDEPPPPEVFEMSAEDRQNVRTAIADTKKQLEETTKRVEGRVLGTEVVDAMFELEDRLRIMENQLSLEEQFDKATLKTAAGEELLRSTLVQDAIKPLDTRTLVRQADLLSKQATRGMDDVKKETVKQATRLAMTMQQFESDRAAMLLAGPSIARMDVMQRAFADRWRAALVGLGVTAKHKEAWAAKGINLDDVAANSTTTQNFVQALFGTMGEEGRAFFNMSKYATMQSTLGSLAELLPSEYDSTLVEANMKQYGMEIPADLRKEFGPADFRNMAMLQEMTDGLNLQGDFERLYEDVAAVVKSFTGGAFNIVKMSATQWALESALLGAVKSVALPLATVGGMPLGPFASFVASMATQSLFQGVPVSFAMVKRQATNALFGSIMKAASGHYTSTDYGATLDINIANKMNEHIAATADEAAGKAMETTKSDWLTTGDATGAAFSGARWGILGGLATLAVGPVAMPFVLPAAGLSALVGGGMKMFGATETVAQVAGQVSAATTQLGAQWDMVTPAMVKVLRESPTGMQALLETGKWGGRQVPAAVMAQLMASQTAIGSAAQRLGLLSQWLAKSEISAVDRLLQTGTTKLPFTDTMVSNRALGLLQALNNSVVNSPANAVSAFQKIRDVANKSLNVNGVSVDNVQSDWYQWLVQQNAVRQLSRARQRGARRLKPPKSRGLFKGLQKRLDQRTGEQVQ